MRIDDVVPIPTSIVAADSETAEATTHRAPPPMVAETIVEDGIKKRLPFFLPAIPVAGDETAHRLLDQIKGILAITGGKKRHTIGGTFDTPEKGIHNDSC